MDKNERDRMIESLAQTLPRYAYNSKDFKPGESPVYYSGPYFDHREIEYALKALLTGKWITSGEYVNRFQNEYSKMFNVKHSHMVNSGSSANLVMITALKKKFGWRNGDEVIVSPVGFPTTIAPLVQNNLTPVFIDIEFNTLNFNLALIEDEISDKTRAIFVSPVLGNPPNMDALQKICKKYDIMLIGDNCDSLGSKWDGKNLNEYYYSWTSSFYPAHHITTGEGGMISTDDEDLINTVRSISWWGRDCHCVGAANLLACGTCGNRFDKWLEGYDGIIDHKYLFTNMGYNLKPLDLQGAIGLAQLEKFDEIEKLRRKNFLALKNMINDILPDDFRVASNHDKADPCWFGVPIIAQDQKNKEKLVKHFEDNKIQTRSYFAGNILMQPAYKHLGDYRNFPISNLALSHVFFIGCPPHYNSDVFAYIEKVLKKFK